VAITDVAIEDDHVRASTAALVGAAISSTIGFRFVGRALRHRVRSETEAVPAAVLEAPASAAQRAPVIDLYGTQRSPAGVSTSSCA
jgi:hypothetical protein